MLTALRIGQMRDPVSSAWAWLGVETFRKGIVESCLL
jgi:hypothetical protein